MNGIRQNDQIKLVVWDLDDTFWNGTLSEGGGYAVTENIDSLRTLVDRGIMNAISSKNDYNKAKRRLVELGVWDMFVFPCINWNPKGPQIADIIRRCRLRPENVLFVDDNVRNLEEAISHVPGLQTATPEILPRLLSLPSAAGHPDPRHARLSSFKLLERKDEARKLFSSNDEFLRNSKINVSICEDCRCHADRILELIKRTNQLNFTKKRIGKDELENLLCDSEVRNFVITVSDVYGDYGIVGFAAVRNFSCEHFLFSCRILGLGVEQWVYSELGFPRIAVIGETASVLSSVDRPEWINNVKSGTPALYGKKNSSGLSVLLRGGCDLRQMEQYLAFDSVDCEFNHLNYHRDHTVFAVDMISPSAALEEIKTRVPFLCQNVFDTSLYDGRHDIIVFSLLIDYIQAVYRFNADPSIRIAHGVWMMPLSDIYTAKYSKDDLEWLFENFTCTGRITAEELRSDLEKIRSCIPPHVHLIMINGCEVSHENPDEQGTLEVHVELNRVVDSFVAAHAVNTHLLDMRRIVTSRDRLTNNIRHYTREVYRDMAVKIEEIASEIEGNIMFAFRRRLRRFWRSTKRLIASWFKSMSERRQRYLK